MPSHRPSWTKALRLIVVALAIPVTFGPAPTATAQTTTGTLSRTLPSSFSYTIDGGQGDGGAVVSHTLLSEPIPSSWTSLDGVSSTVLNLVDQGWGNTFATNTVGLQLLSGTRVVWSQTFGHANHTPATVSLSLTESVNGGLFDAFSSNQPAGGLSLSLVGTVAGWPGASLNGSGASLLATGVIGGTTTITGNATYSGTTSFNSNPVVITGTVDAGTVIVGNSAEGILLTVETGGRLASTAGIIGNSTSATGNAVLIEGAGATWSTTSGLNIGNSGASNTLTIRDGGSLSAGTAVQAIGTQVTSSSNSLVVTGSGSTLTSTAALKVGFNGDFNSLTIADGGSISGAFAVVGDNLGDNNSAVVTGAGSSWLVTNSVFVGNSGSSNSLTVAAGGNVSADSFVAIGQNAASNGNVAIVTGSGSLFLSGGALEVGNGGSGNMLSIEAGGGVWSDYGVVGGSTTAGNNVAIVSGDGSYWSSQWAIDVGYYGSGSLLTVSDGAIAQAPVVNVALMPGSSGSVVISGTSKAGVLDTTNVAFGSGNGSLVFSHAANGLLFTPIISGSGSVSHAGPGSTTLSGTSGFFGTISVSGGSLAIDGALTHASATVTGGVLGGSGSIGGATTITSGTLAPGGSIGTLNSGPVSLDAGATSLFELGTAGTTESPGISDRVIVHGDLILGGSLRLADNDHADGLGSAGPGSYLLFVASGSTSGAFTTISDLDGYRGQITTASGTTGGSSVSLANYLLASAQVTQTIVLPAAHTATGTSTAVTLTNLSVPSGYTETLASGTYGAGSPGFFLSGSASGIIAGGSGTGTLRVGFTGSASLPGGVYSGTTTLGLLSVGLEGTGFAPQPIAPQAITVTGTAWNLAVPVLEPLYDFGSVHVGDIAFLPVLVTNAAPTNGFSEGLDIEFDIGDSLDATVLGSITDLAAGATSVSPESYAQAIANNTNDFLAVVLNTLLPGDKQAEIEVLATSDGNGTSGLGLTRLGDLTIEVQGAVYSYADPVVEVDGAILPALQATITLSAHVGDPTLTKTLVIENWLNPLYDEEFAESLDVTPESTGGITVRGTVDGLAPDESSDDITLSLATSSAGAIEGSVTLNFTSLAVLDSDLDDTELQPLVITVNGGVYAYANPSVEVDEQELSALGATVNLGTVRVDSISPTTTLAVTNAGTDDGYTESLAAALTNPSGGAFGTGVIAGLAPGQTSTALSIGIATDTAGVVAGSITLSSTSVAVPGSNLADTPLQPLNITVTGTINAIATPAITSASPYFSGSGRTYSIDFGTVEVDTAASATLALQNFVTGPADSLAGLWDNEWSGFMLDGFEDFGLTGSTTSMATALAPGAYLPGGLTVLLNTESPGDFSGTLVLTPYSVNPFQTPFELLPITIMLAGVVEQNDDPDPDPDPEPHTVGVTATATTDAVAVAVGVAAASVAVASSSSAGTSSSGGNDPDIPAIPEPSSGVILLTGFAALATFFRRKQRRIGQDVHTTP